MGNVGRVWRRDVVRVARVPLAWIIVLGLIVLPCMYAWFNIVGFWDPYGHTEHIRVVVVNQDEGVDDDLTGRINLGDQIVKKLRTNHQLGWQFMDSDEQALSQVTSAQSYAAIVIPRDFSARLASLLHGKQTNPSFDYYVNEKASPLTPKVTDAGASSLDRQINDVFVASASKSAASAFSKAVGSASDFASKTRVGVIGKLDDSINRLGEARSSVRGLSADLRDSQDAIAGTRTSLDHADALLGTTQSALAQGNTLIDQIRTDSSAFTGTALGGLGDASSQLGQASTRAHTTIGQASAAATEAKGHIDSSLGTVEDILERNEAIISALDRPPANENAEAAKLIGQLKDADAALRTRLTALRKASDDAGGTVTAIERASDAVDDSVKDASDAGAELSKTLTGEVLPQFDSSLSALSRTAQGVSGALGGQRILITQLRTLLDQLDSSLGKVRQTLAQTDATLASTQSDLQNVSTDVRALGSSATWQALQDALNVNPGDIASFMSSPTTLHTTVLYPVSPYGTAIAPLFTNVGLWAGAFMLAVIFKLEVDDEGIPGLTTRQRYLGRLLTLSTISAIQALSVSIGDLIIGVRTVSPPAFIFACLVAALTFMSLIYALSVAFVHVGKGLCLVLVIMQVPGTSGLYPIETLPSFFGRLYPLLPFTYAIDAMREAIGGFYQTQYLRSLGVLALFFAISLGVGLVLRPYMTNLNNLFGREISQGDLFVGEVVQATPGASYRLSQIIRVLTDRTEYREAILGRAKRFVAVYPRLKRAGFAAVIAVPVLLAIPSSLNSFSKPTFIALWIVWVLIIITALMIMEFVRDTMERQVRLSGMSERDITTMLHARRRHWIAPQPRHGAGAHGETGHETGGDSGNGDHPRGGDQPGDGETTLDLSGRQASS